MASTSASADASQRFRLNFNLSARLAAIGVVHSDHRHRNIRLASLACSVAHIIFAIYWFVNRVEEQSGDRCASGTFADILVVSVSVILALVQFYGVYKEVLLMVVTLAIYSFFSAWYGFIFFLINFLYGFF